MFSANDPTMNIWMWRCANYLTGTKIANCKKVKSVANN